MPVTAICTVSNPREEDGFLKLCSEPDKMEPFLTCKNLICLGLENTRQPTSSKGGGPSPNRLCQKPPPPARPACHRPLKTVSPTLPSWAVSEFPSLLGLNNIPLYIAGDNLPRPLSCPRPWALSPLPAPEGRGFCIIYLIESIYSSGKCFNPSSLFFS